MVGARVVEDWLRRAEQELEETQNLEDEIDRVNHRRSLQGIEFITSTDFMVSESSKSAFNQILEAIKAVNMIGLYEMPGVGKTTLAKEVGKHAREQKLFDKVVMFTMSQNPNIRTIQDKVAEMFGLNFRTNTEEGRAEELWVRLKAEKDILIIVDDLWEEFKLESSIGIPFGDDHKGCKILLTTRQQQVCSKMKCQKEIQLGILSKDEAWVLFRNQAGLEDDYSSLNEVAKEVAGECKGLPLAIVTVAKALKGESLDGWKAANQRFKDSRHLDNKEVLGGVLKPLKLSYDYLKKGKNQITENDIQMCFLLCSLFREDAEIRIEILIVCGIGVGLFPNASSTEDKRNEIGVALKKLQKSGLLLETDDAERIRMHDVVRDFAHWLTSTGENRFMVKDKLKEWPDMVESFEGYTAIALWNCSSNIKNFPDKVEFSKLKTLFIHREWKGDDLPEVSSTFFEEMKALQVLKLEGVYFSLKGFNSLPNLKTLWCEYCKLENFSSSLTNMRSLEILVLISTEIDEISEELVKLSTLKYLCLEDVEVEEEEEEEEEMKIPPKLVSRYNIDVGGLEFIFEEELTIRILRIENFSSLLSAFKNLFCNVGELKLKNVSGLKNILPSIGVLNGLTSLDLDSCVDMEFLTDITRDQGLIVAFSNLVKLKIETMVSLKGLCYGLSPSHHAIASLTRLKVVTIKSYDKLKTIFSPCLAQSMLCIEELHIEFCHGLEQVIGFVQEEEITKDQVSSSSSSNAGLQPISFPNLTRITITNCGNLKSLFPFGSVPVLPKLKYLEVQMNSKLEQVSELEDKPKVVAEEEMKFDKLEILSLEELPSLIHFAPKGCHFVLSALEDLKVRDCPKLTASFSIDSQEFLHCETKEYCILIIFFIESNQTIFTLALWFFAYNYSHRLM
ncbi:putative disease resistance protein [Gossypium australe]|uniref:Putative disease resistance protein n=1 Tax=Gossypium australe TaxID=47621 RepID=A0A5B6U4Q5_9ROSI|nr:putative disease resistance protein [Gossypium australe]